MTPPVNGMPSGGPSPSLREYEEARASLDESPEPAPSIEVSADLRRFLAEIKGQSQFLLYLADQIEESLDQLVQEPDHCHQAFLCKILGMYSSQLETKHQGLGEKIAEACQEVYVTIREHEMG